MANILVRHATPEDAPRLVELGKAMHEESPRFSPFSYDHEKAKVFIESLMASPFGRIILVEKEGEIVAMIAGFILELFFSHDITACDAVVYVTPGHRGGTAFVRLIRAFEKEAKGVIGDGRGEIIFGVNTEVHAEETAGMYERLGYRRAGITMQKKVGYV